MPLSVRKVIARRAAGELAAGDIVNLGFGMPDGVASVLAEEGLSDEVTFTVEQGHIGGVPALGANFGMARNQHAMVSADHQFDWYDGGGVDLAVLSFAQVDRHGNVNVGKFAGRMPGVGGFVNISQGARRVVFVGTLTAGRPAFRFQAGLRIDDDHGTSKFVEAVEQVSFSAWRALAVDQRVLYVTERAVFELTADGPLLTEVAPGLDIERDVLARLAFRPKLSAKLATMDAALFGEPPLGLRLRAREVAP
jgi:propionate CoA-transferase